MQRNEFLLGNFLGMLSLNDSTSKQNRKKRHQMAGHGLSLMSFLQFSSFSHLIAAYGLF